MLMKAIVEITSDKDLRWIYSDETQTFEKVPYKSRAKHRGFKGVYGWIDGYGTPPENHVDAFVVTQNRFDLGDTVDCKLVGAFHRCDGDHKLICIESKRPENDLYELSQPERDMIFNLYDGCYEGDEWLGKEGALALLEAYDQQNKVRKPLKQKR